MSDTLPAGRDTLVLSTATRAPRFRRGARRPPRRRRARGRPPRSRALRPRACARVRRLDPRRTRASSVRTRPRRTITITTESTDPRGRAFALWSARVLVANVSGSEPDPDSDPDPTATKRTLDRLEAEAIRRERERLYPPPPDIRGGGALLRVVAFALALWCHALAPLGGRWGAVPSGADPSCRVRRASRKSVAVVRGVVSRLRRRQRRVASRLTRRRRPSTNLETVPPSHAQGQDEDADDGEGVCSRRCACALAFTGFADATAWSATAATLAFADRLSTTGKLREGNTPVDPGEEIRGAVRGRGRVLRVAGAGRVETRTHTHDGGLVGGWSTPMGRWFGASAFAAVAESNA